MITTATGSWHAVFYIAAAMNGLAAAMNGHAAVLALALLKPERDRMMERDQRSAPVCVDSRGYQGAAAD